jgi:hypothetical protein
LLLGSALRRQRRHIIRVSLELRLDAVVCSKS